MTYRWQRENGLPQELASADLRPADVPPSPVSADDHDAIGLMIEFAHTFNGYRWGGPPHQLGEVHEATYEVWRRTGELPDDPDRVRACLFYWVRADRHGGGYGPTEDDLPWLGALLDALRGGAEVTPSR